MKIKYCFYLILIISTIKESTSVCIPGDNCPTYSGVCKIDICECLPGYQTLINDNTNPVFCNYKQYSKWYPFILELFFPAIGLFYIRRYFHAIIKLILFIIVVGGNTKISGMWFFLFALMYIADLILLYFKVYKDGYGIPLI